MHRIQLHIFCSQSVLPFFIRSFRFLIHNFISFPEVADLIVLASTQWPKVFQQELPLPPTLRPQFEASLAWSDRVSVTGRKRLKDPTTSWKSLITNVYLICVWGINPEIRSLLFTSPFRLRTSRKRDVKTAKIERETKQHWTWNDPISNVKEKKLEVKNAKL